VEILTNQSVFQYNTFGIDVKTKYLASFKNIEELKELLQSPLIQEEKKLIIGGGSNVLFTKNYEGVILVNKITGIDIVEENEEHVLVKVGAGENWHEFVMWSINNQYAGIENLSLIPGSVGASPMQNIGAYGVEIKDVFHQLEAVEIKTGNTQVFNHKECAFGYRESVFKNVLKDQFVITSVTYKLNKKPVYNISYGAIKQQLEENNVEDLSIKEVANAVIQIRQSKLPDPQKIGNAGSFFKNPIVSQAKFEELKQKFPEIAHYLLPDSTVKLAAGWLIDNLGWKGKRVNNHGVHSKQALVLVNYGGSSGEDIYNLSEDIIASVKEAYGVELEREVNIY